MLGLTTRRAGELLDPCQGAGPHHPGRRRQEQLGVQATGAQQQEVAGSWNWSLGSAGGKEVAGGAWGGRRGGRSGGGGEKNQLKTRGNHGGGALVMRLHLQENRVKNDLVNSSLIYKPASQLGAFHQMPSSPRPPWPSPPSSPGKCPDEHCF